jgi:hypothetical protein
LVDRYYHPVSVLGRKIKRLLRAKPPEAGGEPSREPGAL